MNETDGLQNKATIEPIRDRSPGYTHYVRSISFQIDEMLHGTQQSTGRKAVVSLGVGDWES